MAHEAVHSVVLAVTFLDYWHAGSGRGAGLALDAVVDRNAHGLPRVGGRMLKGLLREASWRAERWRIIGKGTTEELFGSGGFGSDGVPRDLTEPGALRVGDAELPDAERRVLVQEPMKYLHRFFFRELFATAIEEGAGVAKTGSLRGIEVTVPLELEARITWIGRPDSAFARSWPQVLRSCVPLVRSVGAHRSRGLGRAQLAVREMDAAPAGPGTA